MLNGQDAAQSRPRGSRFAPKTLGAAWVLLCATMSVPVAWAADKALVDKAAASGDEAVVATVNGEPISNASLQLVMGTILTATPPTQRSDITDAQQSARETLIVNLVVAQAARKLGLGNDPDVEGVIAYQNAVTLSRAYFKARLRQDPLTDERVKQEYERGLDHGKVQEFHVAHMVVAQKSRAEELLVSLAKGEKFETLARLYSQDTNAATNSGDLGWLRIDQMDDYHFVDAVKSLKPGVYSKQVVKGSTGWHVIKLLETPRLLKDETLPYEKLPKAVADKMRARALQRQIDQIQEALVAKAIVTRASDLITYAAPVKTSGSRPQAAHDSGGASAPDTSRQ
jgi:peptidyl-prolyl cis-trans isomerase C